MAVGVARWCHPKLDLGKGYINKHNYQDQLVIGDQAASVGGKEISTKETGSSSTLFQGVARNCGEMFYLFTALLCDLCMPRE